MRQKLTRITNKLSEEKLNNESFAEPLSVADSIQDMLKEHEVEKSIELKKSFSKTIQIMYDLIISLEEQYQKEGNEDKINRNNFNKIDQINLLWSDILEINPALNIVNKLNYKEQRTLLKCALQYALKIEHSTIPPYLTALYSIKRGSNLVPSRITRSVAIEEMLHLIMVCNVLNSMDMHPDILKEKLVPTYPYHFPFNSENSIVQNEYTSTEIQNIQKNKIIINIEAFSKTSLDTFIRIESPISSMVKPLDQHIKSVKEKYKEVKQKITSPCDNEQCYDEIIFSLPFEKIGEFYEFITVLAFITQLKAKREEKNNQEHMNYEEFCQRGLFSKPNITKQISTEQYYGSGGQLITVEDFHDFLEVILEITGQGEGTNGEMVAPEQAPDQDGLELAHYFRFMEVRHGHYYVGGKYKLVRGMMRVTTRPNGNPLKVDWDQVYPIQKNFKIKDLEKIDHKAGLKSILEEFNFNYFQLINYIQKAISTEEKEEQNNYIHDSIQHMHQMHHQAESIMKIKLNDGKHAAPTWEILPYLN